MYSININPILNTYHIYTIHIPKQNKKHYTEKKIEYYSDPFRKNINIAGGRTCLDFRKTTNNSVPTNVGIIFFQPPLFLLTSPLMM